MHRLLSPWRFAFIALATAVVAVASLTALPHHPYLRYQSFDGTIFERLRWVYERTHFDPVPVDVLILGSSREGAGVVGPELEAALAERGRPLHVANFSIPASGMDIRVTLLNEVLRGKRPKLLLIGVTDQLPRDGHQAFGTLGTAGEIIGSPLMVNRKFPANLGRLPFRQVKLAASTLSPEAFGMDPAFVANRYPGTSFKLTPAEVHGDNIPAGYTADLTPAAQAAALAAESAQRRTEITRPILPHGLGDIEFGVSRSSLRRLVETARANGVEVRFLFLPFYQGFDRPLDAGWLEAQAPLWTTDALMRDPANFVDAAHMTGAATPGVADWLADRIVAELP